MVFLKVEYEFCGKYFYSQTFTTKRLFVPDAINKLGKRRGDKVLKSNLTTFVRITTLSFLVITSFSYIFSRLNTCEKAYATCNIPPTLTPFVGFDLYTQKGGVGPNTFGGEFALEENVTLCVKMTNNDFPAENCVIVFEIVGPTNNYLNISFIRTAVTNSSGIAYQTFNIQPINNMPETVLGTWIVTAQSGLDQETVVDTLHFEVASIMPEFPTFTVSLFILLVSTAAFLARKYTQR
jgi:hypothetical protein